jgi:hypothetical protein
MVVIEAKLYDSCDFGVVYVRIYLITNASRTFEKNSSRLNGPYDEGVSGIYHIRVLL